MAFKKYTQGKVSLVRENICCSCDSDEHQLNFRYFTDKDDTNLYCTFHLVPERNILKRILKAVKYVFGYKSKYGHFSEVILDDAKVQELKFIIKNFEESNK
jgi:hypothetical protein